MNQERGVRLTSRDVDTRLASGKSGNLIDSAVYGTVHVETIPAH
jgi:hypothetical protein